jgi:hypothetical protein
MGAGRGNVVVTSRSPSNKDYKAKIEDRDSKYYAKLAPSEIGKWSTHVFFDNEEVKGSPYVYEVFDPNAAKINNLNPNQTNYPLNKPISFQGKLY